MPFLSFLYFVVRLGTKTQDAGVGMGDGGKGGRGKGMVA